MMVGRETRALSREERCTCMYYTTSETRDLYFGGLGGDDTCEKLIEVYIIGHIK
jgi:hypothetical protein